MLQQAIDFREECDALFTILDKLNQNTGDWHRDTHADRSRVVTLLQQLARSFCAKNNDSGNFPYGASPDVG
jgi:hypothetical protein